MGKTPVFFRHHFQSEEQAEAVMRISCPHYVKYGAITAATISIFEIFLLLRVAVFGLGSVKRNVQYSCCYIFLLVVSIILLVHLYYWSKNYERHLSRIYYIQVIYTIIFIAWGVVITLLDGYYHGFYDVIVYMSISLVMPIIVFENIYVLGLSQLIGDAIILIFIIKSGSYGGAINFFAYTVTSIFACVAFQSTKKKLYIKQYELNEKAIKDSLTGILNRQTLIENGDAIWDSCLKKRKYISVIMGDIDLFKNINDQYGHLSGDRCIKNVANVFNEACTREGYSCYRYGGEEFVLLLPDTDGLAAINKAEEIMKQVKAISKNDEEGIDITISLGVFTGLPSKEEKFEGFLSIADELLYKSKTNGRNQYTSMVQ